MSASRERRVLGRIVRWSLVGAFAVQLATSMLAPAPGVAQESQVQQGGEIFAVNCSSCHGVDASGTPDGPSLIGVGAAAVDFQLTTGRMPLGDPNQQPVMQAPKFSQGEIDAIVAYVSSLSPDGPPIPDVNPADGQLQEGMRLFVNTCASCHGSGATGDSVGGGQIAPTLYEATPTQIGEAIRTGPGVMPRFGDETITDEQMDSIAHYLLSLRSQEEAEAGGVDAVDAGPGGAQLGRVGAVAEGLVALVIGLGLISIVLYLSGSRS